MKLLRLIFVVVWATTFYAPWVSAGKYTWTDKDGVMHSSDMTPEEYREKRREASSQADEELSPEVSQTLFHDKKKTVAPEDIPTFDTAPASEPSPMPQTTAPDAKAKPSPTPKPPTHTKESAVDSSVEAIPKSKAVRPVLTPTPAPSTPKPASFYRNQISRIKELIKSQEELIAEDVRIIGLIENRINQMKSIQGPQSERLKIQLREAEKDLEMAKKRLKQDVRELQVLKGNVTQYQYELKSAR